MSLPQNPPPHDLAALPFWLVWRLVYIEGQPKPRKVPYYTDGTPRGGTQGTDEDRDKLVTYDDAIGCLSAAGDYYSGVGFALQADAGIVALDFDDCVFDGRIAQHVEDLCSGTYTEFSPSGTGVRAFFAGTLMSKKDVDAKRGDFPVEVFGHNGFVTFTGQVTETCSLFGWDGTLAPLTPAVLQMYRDRGWDDAQTPGAASEMALMSLQPTLDITNAEVAEWLAKLPNDMDYDDWVKVGAAVHQQTLGSDEGFALFDNWSKLSPKYTSEDFSRGRWRSYGKYTGGNMITFAWVIKQAKESELRQSFNAKDELQEKIKASDSEFMLRTKLCPEIARDARIDHLAREALAKVLQKNLKRLGSEYPLADCKRMIAPPRQERADRVEDDNVPEWLDGFVWVNELDKFYHCGRGLPYSTTSFNAAYNRHMPRADGAAMNVLKTASAAALEDYGVPTVARAMYLPWANSQGTGLFDMEGVSYVNTFRAASLPRAVAALDDEGRAAVEFFRRHVSIMCSHRPWLTEYVLSWMAFCVQKPGVKIRHAVLFKGIEGDGKTFMASALAKVMGQVNVKTISPTVLGTDFSDWAFGACIGVLEEIRMAGHNRHDIYNRLKPMITNDTIPVHPKGKAEINVANTMNYFAFTNHNDALPLSDTDRRWLVIFTRYATRDALEAYLATLEGSAKAYWDMLSAAINLHFASLRRWLLDYRVSPDFNENGNAPMTEEKQQMQNASASPEEELVREIMSEGAAGVGADILSSTSLIDACTLADSEVSLQSVVINRILTKLGWVKLPKRVKWQGRAHRIWVRGEVPVHVQDALEKTLQKNADAEKTSNLGFDEVPVAVNLF